jgi:hypothetical protein
VKFQVKQENWQAFPFSSAYAGRSLKSDFFVVRQIPGAFAE